MGELGELFRDWKEQKQEKKRGNFDSSIEILDNNGIEFQQLSQSHLRISDWDFWPSTWLFINRKTKERGRGVFNLIKKVYAK